MDFKNKKKVIHCNDTVVGRVVCVSNQLNLNP